MKSDEFGRDFKLLRHERVSRARNEYSSEFLNAYGHFRGHQISQHLAPEFAVGSSWGDLTDVEKFAVSVWAYARK